MKQLVDLRAEQEYTAKVQELLLAVIQQSDLTSGSHSESIRAIIADAWEDLRMRPTALSPYDIEQLSAEIDRFAVRKTFTDSQAARYRRMLMSPFFARIDFIEEGETALEKIVIGLYSLKNEKGEIMVHDWRAPVCSLYYDAMPGAVEYRSPSGIIRGEMTLKRQYKMEDGKLLYYVDTQFNIDDELLLDILSGATSGQMRQIVSTIQAEQNAAIRADADKIMSVVGAAGSGKTSVAMHRAAYIMYRQRDVLEASRVQILSPSNVFSEYISSVLPELGEENIKARTLPEIVSGILGKKVETPLEQLTRLLDEGGELRRKSVAYKTSAQFQEELDRYIETFTVFGPDFANVWLEGKLMIRREELRRMYKDEFKLLTPAQRLIRVGATLDTRFESWEKAMYQQYEKKYAGKYNGRELRFVCRMAVSQRLQPIRLQLRAMLDVKGDALMKHALRSAPVQIKEALRDNMQAGIVWWEDAVAAAYMLVKLGFVQPDKSIHHLLIDEAQDYSDTALRMLGAYFPRAKVTLLGDPMQRTCPEMGECDPGTWGACFGEPDAKVFELTKCYRSTMPIARLCNALLPGGERLIPFGREGEMPLVAPYTDDLLKETLARFRAAGLRSIAVITRTPAQANALSAMLDNVYRLDGEDDAGYEAGDTVVGCYHLMKGMEFDAAIVVWPDCELTDEERRRLYTSCSRALHAAALLGGKSLINELGIVL
ncbi:MAG: HelD family protein [Christensenellales bacterium]|jgi:DNA helicase-2/ATP-dependent DNA helicase PcrA